MPHRLSIRKGHPRGCPSCHLVEDEATILDVHLLAIERVAPDARVLGLRLVPVLHEHEDRTRPDDGGAGLEDGAAHVIPVRGDAAVLEEDEINAILGLVLHREAEPVEDAARSLLLGIEPELAALRLLVVIPGKRLPHARVQRQLDEPAVILPLDGEDALQQDRLVLTLNLPPPVALRLEHVGSFLSVACGLIIATCRTTNVVNYNPTRPLHKAAPAGNMGHRGLPLSLPSLIRHPCEPAAISATSLFL
ncbi:hypothetical protein QSI_2919 [Clostridioides difficile P28]|nr:hypothetical protein QSI_2919 [Clostridioides difficile P28]